MDFLTASQFYPLEAALTICQRKNMVSEQVRNLHCSVELPP